MNYTEDTIHTPDEVETKCLENHFANVYDNGIKRVPKTDVATINFKETFEQQEISMLKMYMIKYPDKVKKFAEELKIKLT